MTVSVETSSAIYRIYDRFTADRHQVFVVVGGQYGEGATYSGIRIAEGAAELLGSLSVLIVDMNTQDQKLSSYIGSPELGWGEWLTTGKQYPINRAVTSWPDLSSLNVLPVGRGQKHKDLAKLLMQWPEVLDELRKQYDLILLDALPFFRGEESRMVCKIADDVLVVIEAEQSRRPQTHAMVESLRTMGCPILGAVLNKRRFHIPRWAYERFF
ncbi:MAG: hypothetical protein V3S33_06370 [Gammaproteobacteria bacterium]